MKRSLNALNTGWYASFSRVTREAAARMWDELRLPFEVKESELEHGFFSNFEHSTVTCM
jgi:hypothetical protein